MLLEVCKEAGIESSAVYDIVVAGNTAMHHVFLNIQPRFLGLSPYIAATNMPVRVKGHSLGLKINRGGSVYALPCVAGFVGADAIADILAAQMHQKDELAMLIDIGTNTEIILGNKDRLMAASCPAGPALEGYGIKNGIRASPGAVEKVWINPKTLEVRCETVDDIPPTGICGSGIIDAMAWMVRTGYIDKAGRLNDNHKRVRRSPDGLEFVLCRKEDGGSDIVITQKDIREVQLAKGITYTTASLLMKKFGVKEVDLKQFYLAGAFGTYLDYHSARVIGFIPDLPPTNVYYMGNSAGSGARAALLSLDVRKEASELAKMIIHVELSKEPEFQTEFAESLFFPHKDVGRFPTYVKLTEVS